MLAFLSSRTDEHEDDQVWLLPLAGGEAERVTEIKGGVEDFAWSPDSKRLVLVVQDPDPRDPEGHEKDKKTVPPIVIDRFQFKQDKEGYLTDRYRHLRLLDLGTRKVENLTEGKHDDVLPSWSPDGQEVAFRHQARHGPRPHGKLGRVRRCRADRGQRAATDHLSGERRYSRGPRAPRRGVPAGSSWPICTARTREDRVRRQHAGGDPRQGRRGARAHRRVGPQRHPAALVRRRKSLTALEEDDGAQTLVRISPEGDTAVHREPGGLRTVDVTHSETILGGRRDVTAYEAASGGHIVALVSTPERPAEVFAVEGETLRPLSKQNDDFFAKVKVARTEETRFKSADGTEVHGFLVHALDAPTDRKGPALLRPHGGPQSQYACAFNFEAQLFAANGYAVILPNPRGSTGRGEQYAMGIYAAWGGVDVQDDLAAVDDAVARGIADPDKLGVGGWSYGGLSTNYLIASTTRFRAATSGASISNVSAGFGTRPVHPRLRGRARFALGTPGDVAEDFLSVPARRPHQDAHAVSVRGERLQRSPAQQRADVPGIAGAGRADGTGHLSRAVPRLHKAELPRGPAEAVFGLVREVDE